MITQIKKKFSRIIRSPQKESARCNPKLIKSIYARAKLLSSIYLMNLYKKKNFPSTILRLYQAYGPRQKMNRFIPIIIDSCIKNKKFDCSEGSQFRDFVHVEDVVEAIIKSLANEKARGKIINVGSGQPRKIRNIIEHIRKISKGGYPLFGKIKLRKDEIFKQYPSISKA